MRNWDDVHQFIIPFLSLKIPDFCALPSPPPHMVCIKWISIFWSFDIFYTFSINLSVCMSAYLSFYLHVCLSIFLSQTLYILLSIFTIKYFLSTFLFCIYAPLSLGTRAEYSVKPYQSLYLKSTKWTNQSKFNKILPKLLI